jgi:hypothetical protein
MVLLETALMCCPSIPGSEEALRAAAYGKGLELGPADGAADNL